MYAAAPALETLGIHVLSTDEMTAIQALERAAPTLPHPEGTRPGKVERREFEYVRHGTLSLIANVQVATGEAVFPSLGPTRTEADFTAHIEQTVAADPGACDIFLVDQLNTHKSDQLVRFVAQFEGCTDDLGVQGESGILHSMTSRAAFLNDPQRWIHFVYLPIHTAWLHQIEICSAC